MFQKSSIIYFVNLASFKVLLSAFLKSWCVPVLCSKVLVAIPKIIWGNLVEQSFAISPVAILSRCCQKTIFLATSVYKIQEDNFLKL